ncbi:MAG: hypothetical protein CEO21_315, partial [Microgenomates group bacterium Gr01-1014_80]
MNSTFIIILFLVIVSVFLTGGSSLHPQTYVAELQDQGNSTAEKTLQINALNATILTPAPTTAVTPTPTTGASLSTPTTPASFTPAPTVTSGPSRPLCAVDDYRQPMDDVCQCDERIVTCENGSCQGVRVGNQEVGCFSGDFDTYCNFAGIAIGNAQVNLCIAKPVIYLYPTKKTNV